jgi:eukaryotic-like serine/threonine-protein kinase
MGETAGQHAGERQIKKPKAAGGRRRLIIAALAILAVGLGAWAIWHHLTKPEEITLDLGNNVKMRLVLIPAGKFWMGAPADEARWRNDEGPQHEIAISKPFHMGVFEVTQEQYQQVMGTNPSGCIGATNPVECVSWDDAVEFCKKLSAKTGKKVMLPTEAQWEYACRAGTTTAFNTGNDLEPGEANADSLSDPGAWDKFMDWVRKYFPTKAKAKGPMPVGSFPSNGFGLYDMHGNVWEWCSDWYGADYYANSPKIDPQGPATATGTGHVFRGGSWLDGQPWYCRSACRQWNVIVGRGCEAVGFRVVVLPDIEKR